MFIKVISLFDTLIRKSLQGRSNEIWPQKLTLHFENALSASSDSKGLTKHQKILRKLIKINWIFPGTLGNSETVTTLIAIQTSIVISDCKLEVDGYLSSLLSCASFDDAKGKWPKSTRLLPPIVQPRISISSKSSWLALSWVMVSSLLSLIKSMHGFGESESDFFSVLCWFWGSNSLQGKETKFWFNAEIGH